MKSRIPAQLDEEIPSLIKRRADIYKDQIRWFSLERSLTLFEMTHGLCSCHSQQSEESFSILGVMVD
jgi:hypothetical protein